MLSCFSTDFSCDRTWLLLAWIVLPSDGTGRDISGPTRPAKNKIFYRSTDRLTGKAVDLKAHRSTGWSPFFITFFSLFDNFYVILLL